MPWPDRRSLIVAAMLLAAPGATPGAPLRDHLYGVRAVGEAEAWAVGTFGAIYRTTDGGRSWTSFESGTKQPLFSVDFAPSGRWGLAAGKSGVIVATADGGRSWRAQGQPLGDKHFFKIDVVDERTAWLVGDWGVMATTRDGGATWEDRSLGTVPVRPAEPEGDATGGLGDDVILYDVSFPDARHGYVCGEFGTVLATEDGGATWTQRRVPTEKTLFGLHFATPHTGWVVGIDGLVLRTDDGGRSWVVQHGVPAAAAVDEISFVETMRNPGVYAVRVAGAFGIAVGDVGLVLLSRDGGRTWQRRELPGGDQLAWVRDVSVFPGGRGLVVGSRGFTAVVDGDGVRPPGPSAADSERTD